MSSKMLEKVKLTLDETARIGLNRPDKKDALDLQLLEELGEAIQEAEKSETRVLVLSSEGDTFCSGLDLTF